MPMRRKLTKRVNDLFVTMSVFLASAVMHAQETCAAPAWALLQPRHGHEPCWSSEVRELGATQPRISEAFAKKRLRVLSPGSTRLGGDLRVAAHQEDLLETILRERPRLLWVSPSVAEWREQSPRQGERRERRAAVRFLEFLDRAIKLSPSATTM